MTLSHLKTQFGWAVSDISTVGAGVRLGLCISMIAISLGLFGSDLLFGPDVYASGF
jgi:hypothetical protein